MKKERHKPPDAADLRSRAEEKLKATGAEVHLPTTESDAMRLVHELQVYQIELEMQNEVLRRAGDDTNAWLELYTDLYDFAPLGFFTLDRGGHISRANLTGAKLLGVDRSHLVNRRFGLFVSPETLPAFNAFLKSVFESKTQQTCEAVLLKEEGAPTCVRIEATVPRDGEECRIAVIDITERKQLEDFQSFLLQCGLPGSGEDFFRSLARYLGETLSMDFVCIDRLTGDCLSAETVAVYFDGKFEDNVTYDLKDTPCGDVVGQTICSFPRDVRHLFPQDAVLQEMVAEGYVGITLWSSQGRPIGLIALISRKPLTNPRPAELILQLAAVRAAGELERTQAEEETRSVARFPYENPNPIARIGGDGVLLYSNPAAEPLLLSLGGAVGGAAPPLWRELATEAIERNMTQSTEWEREGTTFIYEVVPVSESGYVNIYARDITERKQMERRQHLSAEILAILNEPIAMAEVIDRVLVAIKRETGFHAVGLRLESGEDFPYFDQKGFPADFLLTENTLLAPDEKGGSCRDKDGSISLECTCGLVISGKTDPANPLFTTGGSFWTNNSAPLLDLPADQDPRLHPRNRCVHEGFLSVALIPIRANEEIVGLLQLNDRREGRFTLEVIRYFEGICASIGLVLMKKQAEKALRQSNEQVTQILESISDAFFALDDDWRFTYVNREAESLLQQPREQLIGAKIWDRFPEAVGSKFQSEYEKAAREGITTQFENYYPPFEKWFEVRAYPYEGGLSVYFRDCTDRRAVEDMKAQASERVAHIADILQQALIPPPMPVQQAGYEIATRYQPALTEAEVGGDFYDMIELGAGKLGILIGDIVGKGVSAASQVAAFMHMVRSYAFVEDRPSRVMTLVNDALCRDKIRNNMLTAFLAILDTRTGELTYTSAGHEPPLVRHPDGIVTVLDVGGPMFSSTADQVYTEGKLSLEAGDLLVMVTDGITEARTAGSPNLFGAEGIVRCLSENDQASADQIASKILEDATSFGNGKLRDDAAIIVIRKLNAVGQGVR